MTAVVARTVAPIGSIWTRFPRESNLQLLERYVEDVLHLRDLLLSHESVLPHIIWQVRDETELALHALATEEQLRLKEKERNMRNSGLDHAPYSLLGPERKDLDARERSLWVQARVALEDIAAASIQGQGESAHAKQDS